jgi:transposase InsO family protein
MVASRSRKDDTWDNAVAESFFATLEWELIDDSDWQTGLEAHRAIAEYIEIWYNRIRRHSSLGYLSPAAYETMLETTRKAA